MATKHHTRAVGPVTLDELRERGAAEDLMAFASTLIGERLPANITDQIPLSDLALFGYGYPCPCGERGMLPGEAVDDDLDMCAECAAAEKSDPSTRRNGPVLREGVAS